MPGLENEVGEQVSRFKRNLYLGKMPAQITQNKRRVLVHDKNTVLFHDRCRESENMFTIGRGKKRKRNSGYNGIRTFGTESLVAVKRYEISGNELEPSIVHVFA